ncbi:recombinase family protein [Pelotomaculum propionicicum]|uniref:Recombinase domain-containing protein n=1 Tax=Pelotomaculum propionicicum TaxID=258475 RepID=A0A4Y7RKU9_9FIRM|nr:recombinase family protein [Pelotomaculum propionicicum]NLI13969.1 recombinase family protein [Peptococcaceae bacterium]TEB09370.1 hypothetical protein Pmgp_03191 [Pelotomaculum propionicicum]
MRVLFGKEKIDTLSAEGELALTVLASIAEEERKSTCENVKWSIRKKYAQGRILAIDAGKLLGYDKTADRGLVINEEEAKIVQMIFDLYLSGMNSSEAARYLNSLGVPSYKGHPWRSHRILSIISNEKYKGDTLFLKTFNADPLTKKRMKNTGILPQYYAENTHTAIIDKDTWECVRLELERQKRYCKEHRISTYHKNNEKHPPILLLFCIKIKYYIYKCHIV